jgi:hypothetical protein
MKKRKIKEEEENKSNKIIKNDSIKDNKIILLNNDILFNIFLFLDGKKILYFFIKLSFIKINNNKNKYIEKKSL